MVHLLSSILSIFVITQFVLGNCVNIFIALVNCMDWVKRQTISSTDGILIALAVSRICLLWVIAIEWYAIVFNPGLHSIEAKTIVSMVWIISNHFSIWLATSLSIFYLLKIANFSSLIFLHLKWKAKRVVLMIVLGTVVFLVLHLAIVSMDENMWRNEYEGNITWKTKLRDIVHLSDMTVFTLGNLIPFTMSLTSVLLLIFSLWKHLKNMQLRGKGFHDPSTKIHIRAMQTVTSFLLLFAIYFLTLIITVWNSNALRNEPFVLCILVLSAFYPSAHSFILIWGNKKLKQNFLSVLWQVKSRVIEQKPSTP